MQEENNSGASAPVPENQNPVGISGGTPAGAHPKTNTLAVLSLVFSFLFALVGLILGVIALHQIKEKGEEGKGLAIAGIIISSIWIVLGLLFWIFVIIIGVSSGEFSGDSNDSDSSLFDQEAETVEGKLGKAFELDDTTVTVTNVRDYISDSQYYQPSAGNKFINIDVEVKNNGTKDIFLTDYGIYAIDAEGNQYDSSFDGVSTDAKTLTGTLTAGSKVVGTVGFEVPVGVEATKLHIESFDSNSQNKATVTLR